MAKKCARTFSIVVEKGKKSILDVTHLLPVGIARSVRLAQPGQPVDMKSDFAPAKIALAAGATGSGRGTTRWCCARPRRCPSPIAFGPSVSAVTDRSQQAARADLTGQPYPQHAGAAACARIWPPERAGSSGGSSTSLMYFELPSVLRRFPSCSSIP